VHWLHVGLVSSHCAAHYIGGLTGVKKHTFILRVLHIWQPREGFPQYTIFGLMNEWRVR